MWVAGPEVILENIGFLPKDTFRTLLIEVDKQTSQIILRRASDNVFLGPIGTSPRNIEALAVVSVSIDPSQTQTPGGPAVEITLKNISSEPIISLTAVLSEPQTFIKNFRYDFAVSALSPLMQNQIASAKSLLITGSWSTGVSYYLTVSGTLQNGTVFYFRWEPPPPTTSPLPTVTIHITGLTVTAEDMGSLSLSSPRVLLAEATVAKGETLVLTLFTHSEYPFKWAADLGDSGIVVQQGDMEFSPDSYPGGGGGGPIPGYEKWTFKALNTGQTTITMVFPVAAPLPDHPVLVTLELRVTSPG